MTLSTNITSLQQRITRYEAQYHRQPGTVKLLAASKNQPAEKILQAYDAGLRAFGENYVKEALEKMLHLQDKEIEWHFIGPIQSNKTRKIAEHFDWTQSVDNLKIAKRLNEQRPAHLPPLNICIEVNISAEATKSGTTPENVLTLAQECLALPRLNLRGLMVIPEFSDNITEQRQTFRKLYQLWQSLREQGINVDTLSMGMSHDFEAAIAEGATMVRIGTAIFGNR